ncbi:MAG: tetratricopeptide repeat protein [Pseudomonadota bacterium]
MRFILATLLLIVPVETLAKPLVTTSEQSLISICTDYADTHERLLQICAAALDEPGLTNRKRAQVLTSYADALTWLDRLDEARDRYEAALKSDPFFAEAREGLGWVHWLEDDYIAAAAEFESALNLSPSSDALGGLASAQFYSDAIDAEEAVTLFDAALAIEPNNRWVWRQKGWMLMRRDAFEAAREAFQAAVDLNDQDAEALEGLSLAHYHLDDDEAALTHINAAIAAAPSTPGYIQRRSMVLLALDRPAAALRDANAYLEARPDAAIGYVRKGRALDALGRTKDALEVMADAHDRLPRDDKLDYWYAMTLSDDGRHGDAWDVMSYYMTQASGDFWDYVLLAFLAVKTDRLDAASDAVGNLQRLRAEDHYTHYWDAVTKVYAGDVDGAEHQIRRALDQGLSDSMLGEFVEHMVGQGYYIRAAALSLNLKKEALAAE